MFLEALHERKLPVPSRLTTCETRYWIQANRHLRIDLGKRTCVIREIAGIEYLDACLLVTIERGDGRAECARLTPEIERHLWISEPQAQVILVRRGESGSGTTRREGECLAPLQCHTPAHWSPGHFGTTRCQRVCWELG
jgi:hypothetical protein